MINQPNPSQISRNASNFGFVILLLVVLGCSGSKLGELLNKKSQSPPPRATPSSSPGTSDTPTFVTKKGEYAVTMDKYNQLSIGTARADVERILGGKGTEISSSTGGGMRFSVNKWEGDDFKSIILSFKNDKIMTKSQVALK